MNSLSPRLRWALAVSVLLSALALWWPDSTVHPTGVDGRTESPAVAQAPPSVSVAEVNRAPETLPTRLPVHLLDKAAFDPFVGVRPPAPPSPAPAKPFVGPIYQPPPPPPPLDYRYLGQMTDPAGQRTVYLARGNANADLPVSVGTRLDEGYVIESIAADGIHLYYPPLHAHTVIPVPPARQDEETAATAPALKSPAP